MNIRHKDEDYYISWLQMYLVADWNWFYPAAVINAFENNTTRKNLDIFYIS